MAISTDLTVDQGSKFSATVIVYGTGGLPLDLTNYTVRGKIRKSFYSSTAVDFIASVQSAEEGLVKLELLPSQTVSMRAGRYRFDIEVMPDDDSEECSRALEGELEVTPSVTQGPSVYAS